MTPPPDPYNLLGGYATGSLTRTERDILMEAALRDDHLFAELAEEEDLRLVLADEPFRQRLISELQARQVVAPRPSRLRILAQHLTPRFHFGWLTAAGAVAALIVIVLIRQGTVSETSPLAKIMLGPGTLPALHSAGILEEPGVAERDLESGARTEPPPSASDAAIALDRTGAVPEYRPGDRMRIGFRVANDSRALLLEERPDGATVRLFPNRFQSSTAVRGNEMVMIPPAGQGDLEVEGQSGRRTLRLLIFPANIDPLAPDTQWDRIKGQARATQRDSVVR